MKNLYLIVHEHRFGNDYDLIRSLIVPDKETVIKALNIDFEPDKGEFMEIIPMDTIVDLDKHPVNRFVEDERGA